MAQSIFHKPRLKDPQVARHYVVRVCLLFLYIAISRLDKEAGLNFDHPRSNEQTFLQVVTANLASA